jgi:hypothetical protein
MAETELIYRQIAAVMRDVGAVAKNQRNQTQGFMYRGIDAVMNAISPAFQKHGVFAVPTIVENSRESRVTAKGNAVNYSICKIEYRFFAEDGSCVTATVIGEAMDSADKATNKAMAVAFKYACFQVLCIPTEEMQDPDGDYTESAPAGKTAGSGRKKGEKKAETKKTAGEESGEKPSTDVAGPDGGKIGPAHLASLKKEMGRTGVAESVLLNLYKVDKLEDMTVVQYVKAMRRFEATRTGGEA